MTILDNTAQKVARPFVFLAGLGIYTTKLWIRGLYAATQLPIRIIAWAEQRTTRETTKTSPLPNDGIMEVGRDDNGNVAIRTAQRGHYEDYVFVEGTTDSKGGLGRVSMDPETFAKLGFTRGQTIPLEKAQEMAFGDPEQSFPTVSERVRDLTVPKELRDLPFVIIEDLGLEVPAPAAILRKFGMTHGQTVTRMQALLLMKFTMDAAHTVVAAGGDEDEFFSST
jgi:hypothetical protein